MESLLLQGVPCSLTSSQLTCIAFVRPLFSHPSACCALFCGFCSSRASPFTAAAAISRMPALSRGVRLKKPNYCITSHEHVSWRMSIPARDRIIDFGKYKGRMLGTLPSKYLIWVSKNLRARDFEEWAKLADEVLNDHIYRDRIEWESAERVLSGDSNQNPAKLSPVSELLDISERFGWDNEDKAGWRRINFELLGTSVGGRIPRKDGKVDQVFRTGGTSTNAVTGNARNISATQGRKERPQLFQEESRAKTSLFGPFKSHTYKSPGLLKDTICVAEISKTLESERVGFLKEKEVGVLEQEKKNTEEAERFEETLKVRRHQRKEKHNLRRRQQLMWGEVGTVEDGKERVTLAKQNNRSNLGSISNPFPGRGEILKKINR